MSQQWQNDKLPTWNKLLTGKIAELQQFCLGSGNEKKKL